jgi:hypothetical protein
MIRYTVLLLITLINSSSLLCQFEKVTEVQLKCSFLTSDSEMNIYAISEGFFLKYPPPYTRGYHYNLAKHGKPDNIDVYSGDRVVIYFQNDRELIILGDTLEEIIRPIYIEELGMNEISLVFSSEDNGLWFYNSYNNSLTKLNDNFVPVIRSVNLNKFFEYPKAPSFMLSFKNNIYINIPSTGVLVLDVNGNYKTGMVMPGLIDFQMDGEFICYFRDNIIYRYHPSSHKTDKVYIPMIPDVINAHIYRDNLILFRPNGFSVYKNNVSTKK